MNNLAELYRTLGDAAKAEPLYNRAIGIWEGTYGPDHPNIAAGLSNLALLYSQKADYVHAEEVIQRALKIREKMLGPDHPTPLPILMRWLSFILARVTT